MTTPGPSPRQLQNTPEQAGTGLDAAPAPLSVWDPLLSLKALSAYSSLSERMLRNLLRERSNPLPHYRVGGRVLVRRSHFDKWLEVYREPAFDQDADAIVRRLVADLDASGSRPHARRG
jgi:excisionase family DNA binding protein